MSGRVAFSDIEQALAALIQRCVHGPRTHLNQHGAIVQLTMREDAAIGVAMGALGAACQALAARAVFQNFCQRDHAPIRWTSLDEATPCPVCKAKP